MNELLLALCHQFKERSEKLGLKGKKRDELAVEFFTGASSVLVIILIQQQQSIDKTLWREITDLTTLILPCRGFKSIEEYITKYQTPAEVTK